MKEQAKIAKRKHKSLVGQQVQVIFEGESAESDLLWQGRMETQAPDIDGCVLINDTPEGFVPVPGEMVSVLITEAQQYDLVGRIVDNGSDGAALPPSVRKGSAFPVRPL